MKENKHENYCRCVVHYLKDEDKENKLKIEIMEKTDKGIEPRQSLMCIERCEKTWTSDSGRVTMRCGQTCNGFYPHQGSHYCQEHEAEDQRERIHREWNFAARGITEEIIEEDQEESEKQREKINNQQGKT
jgi:hypothetical protein